MAILKNDILEVELNPKGAEIIKIVGLKDGLNYMWRRDPSLWASSAPILFPIVGALQNNECRIDGKTYTMTQHGFSRHNEYLTHQLSDTCVEFELTPNEEILKQYPYLFDLKVIYTLKENQLECRCVVTNTDERVIYFQIGGHPAFACPFMEMSQAMIIISNLKKMNLCIRKSLMLNIVVCRIKQSCYLIMKDAFCKTGPI